MSWLTRLRRQKQTDTPRINPPMKGLKLAGHKALSMRQPGQKIAAQHCETLVLPLQQHKGEPAIPQVSLGEPVHKYQCLAGAHHGHLSSAAIHAPTSGIITAIESRPVVHPSGLNAPCIILKPDGQDTQGAMMPALHDYRQYSPSILRERIAAAGIVGLGGAVFPTAAKLNAAPHIHTLIINGAECEPYITCDDYIMCKKSTEIIQGIQILLYLLADEQQTTLQAGQTLKLAQPDAAIRCLVGIEDNKPQAIRVMQQAVTQAMEQQNKHLIHICSLPSIYPGGGEKQLIHYLTGQEIPHHRHPVEQGVLCLNVATVRAIYRAVILGEPLVSRYVTVTGPAINQPANYEVPIGLPIQALITAAGGYQYESVQLKMGGSMMGVPFTDSQVPVSKATNCILVEEKTQPTASHPCIRCGHCAEVCPVNLLPQQLYWHTKAHEFEKAQHYRLSACIECGCCQHVCPSHIPLVDYYRFAKAAIHTQQSAKRQAEAARKRYESRLERLERIKRERAEKLAEHKKAVMNKKAQGEGAEGAKEKPMDKKAAIQAALERAKAKKAEKAGKIPSRSTSGPSAS